jgi:DNA-binding YbaB/EbfC family protein
MFGGFGNMLGMLKNAREIQSRMEAFQKELASRRFDAETGGGAVRVTVDGRGAVVDIKIQPSAAGDVELLEDLLKAAISSAAVRAQTAMKEELVKATGGLDIPGLDNMLGG